MSQTSAELAAAPDEADAVRELHELNAQYIRAFVESDAGWYEEHLADNFVCTCADGRRIGKDEFMRSAAAGPGVSEVSFDEVDVHPLGNVALVHGVTHYMRHGVPASTRYTDVWHLRDGAWHAVAAQLTAVARH